MSPITDYLFGKQDALLMHPPSMTGPDRLPTRGEKPVSRLQGVTGSLWFFSMFLSHLTTSRYGLLSTVVGLIYGNKDPFWLPPKPTHSRLSRGSDFACGCGGLAHHSAADPCLPNPSSTPPDPHGPQQGRSPGNILWM